MERLQRRMIVLTLTGVTAQQWQLTPRGDVLQTLLATDPHRG